MTDVVTPDLPPMHVAARADRLRATLAEAGCYALLVTNPLSIRYLTGFTGSSARLLVMPEGLWFLTDGRYADQAPTELAAAGVGATVEVRLTQAEQEEALGEAVAGVARLGLEAAEVSWADARAYVERFGTAEVVATIGLVEALRAVKDDGEVARLGAASSIADAALAELTAALVPGAVERDLAAALEAVMHRLGSEAPSFETIVASGPNAALPHARPGTRRLAEGDLVILDFGATVDGYHSDMTRTVVVGEPSATQRRMLEVVAAANRAGVDAVRAGAEAVAVDAACRDLLVEAGWGEAFSHGTGHGIGLEIHEGPRVGRSATGTLSAGHVVTIEPGVYLPEHGGVRIEDSVVVEADGCRAITHAPKDWKLPWPSPPTT